MSTNRTLPTTPISAIPSGVDVRDLRPYINRLADAVNTLIIIVRANSQSTRIPVVPPHNPTGRSFDTIVINGTRLTITGTRARYVKFRLDGSAAEWSESEVSPWPADGSVGYIDTSSDEPVLLTQ